MNTLYTVDCSTATSAMQLGIKVIVVVYSCSGGTTTDGGIIRPLHNETSLPRSTLIERVKLLTELVIFRQIVVCHGSPSPGKGFFEMLSGDLRTCIGIHSRVVAR